MSVKGQPEVTGAAAHPDGNERSPTAEAAVGIIKASRTHAARTVDAVIGDLVKGVAAKEVNDKDDELQKLIREFEAKRYELNMEMTKTDKDTEKLKELPPFTKRTE